MDVGISFDINPSFHWLFSGDVFSRWVTRRKRCRLNTDELTEYIGWQFYEESKAKSFFLMVFFLFMKALLSMNRPDLARKEMKNLVEKDEDATITQLAQVIHCLRFIYKCLISWVRLLQIKSNHKGRGWHWTPVVDWRFKSFPCPGFSVWTSSYF